MPHTLVKFFVYDHLPINLKPIFRPFSELASQVDRLLPDSAEKTVCLRKLVEARDAGLRACLETDHPVMTVSDPDHDR